jgi:hypothetical protein
MKRIGAEATDCWMRPSAQRSNIVDPAEMVSLEKV